VQQQAVREVGGGKARGGGRVSSRPHGPGTPMSVTTLVCSAAPPAPASARALRSPRPHSTHPDPLASSPEMGRDLFLFRESKSRRDSTGLELRPAPLDAKARRAPRASTTTRRPLSSAVPLPHSAKSHQATRAARAVARAPPRLPPCRDPARLLRMPSRAAHALTSHYAPTFPMVRSRLGHAPQAWPSGAHRRAARARSCTPPAHTRTRNAHALKRAHAPRPAAPRRHDGAAPRRLWPAAARDCATRALAGHTD
jgi:hypothetical protein